MRRATEQALSIPAFRTPADCTPWVLGGLWPAELERVTPQTAGLAQYLKNDLQRIASSANDKLRAISEARLPDHARQQEETRVINVARAFAVLRVESTVRHLRNEPLGFQPEYLSLGAVPDEPTVVVAEEPTVVVPRKPAPEPEVGIVEPAQPPSPPEPRIVESHPIKGAAEDDPGGDVEDATTGPAQPEPKTERAGEVVDQPVAEDDEPHEMLEPDERDGAVGADQGAIAVDPPPVRSQPRPEPPRRPIPEPTRRSEPPPAPPVRAQPRRPAEPLSGEAAETRLQRLVEFVARQVPGLRWAVGERSDGSILLVTDLAYGWIPTAVDLPAGVELLSPGHRPGTVSALLGPTERVATYRPGDAFSGADRFNMTAPARDARVAPTVDDLGWQLTEATEWRDGLPRMVHTMAKAGASGTGVMEAEVDVLRVHLDTARYQLLAQYPAVDTGLLGNCLLLAATEAIATGDRIAANYHFAWFLELTAPQPRDWRA